MKHLIVAAAAILLTGCATVPQEVASNFKAPSTGMAGVYVYQWKTGIMGSITDVKFEIKGQPTIALNTGEYGYMEVPPGQYEYKASGGLSNFYLPIEFEAGKNYFFRAQLSNLTDTAMLVKDEWEIDDTKKNIGSGRYEAHDVD